MEHKDKKEKEKHKRDKSAHNKDSQPAGSEVGDLLSKQTNIVHNIKVEDTACDFVTVYSDRAEVTRTLNVTIEQEGMKLGLLVFFIEFRNYLFNITHIYVNSNSKT